MEKYRSRLKDKKRIVVKIGSSSLQHPQTGELDYIKLEVLVRELCNLRNQGKDVVLVTSGAIAQGKKATTVDERYFHAAEEQLYEELSIALDMPKEGMRAYIGARAGIQEEEAR